MKIFGNDKKADGFNGYPILLFIPDSNLSFGLKEGGM